MGAVAAGMVASVSAGNFTGELLCSCASAREGGRSSGGEIDERA